jgi:hypothetical protein
LVSEKNSIKFLEEFVRHNQTEKKKKKIPTTHQKTQLPAKWEPTKITNNSKICPATPSRRNPFGPKSNPPIPPNIQQTQPKPITVNPHHKPSLKPIQTKKNPATNPLTNVKETNIKLPVAEHHCNTTQTTNPTTRSIKIPNRTSNHRNSAPFAPPPTRSHISSTLPCPMLCRHTHRQDTPSILPQIQATEISKGNPITHPFVEISTDSFSIKPTLLPDPIQLKTKQTATH